MQLKDLITSINSYNVKLKFDNLNEVREKILQGQSPLYFTPVEGNERKRYECSSSKSKFKSTTDAIHIVDISIDNFIELFKCDGTGIYDYTKEIVKPFCTDKVPESVAIVMFVFLHEVGHWMQFQSYDRNVEEYINKDMELEKDNYDKVSVLQKKRIERINKGNTCPLTTKEKELFKEYMNEYRRIPKEKDADDFALSNIGKTIELYEKTL